MPAVCPPSVVEGLGWRSGPPDAPQPSCRSSTMCISSANSAIGDDDVAEGIVWDAPTASPRVTFAEELEQFATEEEEEEEEEEVEEDGASGCSKPWRPVRNPFAPRTPPRPPASPRRFSILSRPRRSPYLPADVPLVTFACGQPTTKPNLYEGYRTIPEQEMSRLRSGIYLSTPQGKQPILYDPFNKISRPDPRRRSL
eukprot:EG_transcript_5206